MNTFTCTIENCPMNGVHLDFGNLAVSEVCCGGCKNVFTIDGIQEPILTVELGEPAVAEITPELPIAPALPEQVAP